MELEVFKRLSLNEVNKDFTDLELDSLFTLLNKLSSIKDLTKLWKIFKNRHEMSYVGATIMMNKTVKSLFYPSKMLSAGNFYNIKNVDRTVSSYPKYHLYKDGIFCGITHRQNFDVDK